MPGCSWLRLLAVSMAVLLFVGVFTGCQEKTGNYPVTVRGSAIEAQPQRVVSLSPSLTAMTEALGADSLLVAVSDYCTLSFRDTLLPSVGSAIAPDIDAIIERQPDVVLTYCALDGDAAIRLKMHNIAAVIITPAQTLRQLKQAYVDLGMALGGAMLGKSNGERTALLLESRLEEIKSQLAARPTVKTAYIANVSFPDGVFSVATGDTLISELLEVAGGFNVASVASGWTMSRQSLALAAPTVLFCAQGLKEAILSDPLLAATPAVKSSRVYEIDPALVERQGRGLCDAAALFARELHGFQAGGAGFSS